MNMNMSLYSIKQNNCSVQPDLLFLDSWEYGMYTHPQTHTDQRARLATLALTHFARTLSANVPTHTQTHTHFYKVIPLKFGTGPSVYFSIQGEYYLLPRSRCCHSNSILMV